MPCQLPADCLNKIFEYLEKDKVALHSCLLVNRLWCEVSVRILWKDIWNFNYNTKILNTLIACLPDESNDLLHRKGVFISTPTSNPPLFNYASFFKVLSIEKIHDIIEHFFEQSIVSSNNNNDNQNLVTQEILKMFMKQISSLKKLTYYLDLDLYFIPKYITFTQFPGARDCLTNLSNLSCNSDVRPEFFYQLSQICHNIQTLKIQFGDTVSNGLNDLISSQNSLKDLIIRNYYYHSTDLKEILPSLTNHSSALIKLDIDGSGPLSFVTKLTNLQVLILSFFHYNAFKVLQYITFPQLQVVKFTCDPHDSKILIKFLELNGENLREFCLRKSNNSLNSAIAKFCPNLKSLFTLFMNDEVETLKVIFDSCQQLERFESWCDGRYLKEEKMFEFIAKYSPENFHELKLHKFKPGRFSSEDLESFFISWKNRLPHKPLSFIISSGSLENHKENMQIIRKYKKLGIIKETMNF